MLGYSRNIFSTLWWHRFFSTGWKYGAVASLNLRRKSLKISRNVFLQSFYKLRNKRPTPSSSSSLRRARFPLRSWPWKGLLNTWLRFKNVPHIRLPRIPWEASKKIQKTHKRNFSCSSWMQDIEKWFGWWDARHLLHDASLESSVNEAFCNAYVSWHGTNVEAHASHVILHMLHLTTNPYSSQNGETIHIDTC